MDEIETPPEPYWNSDCALLSKQLWLPIINEDSFQSVATGSWFSISHVVSPKPMLTPSVLLEQTSATVIRALKVRAYPTSKQEQEIKRWFGASRLTYNQAVAQLKDPGTVASWMKIKQAILDATKEKRQGVPFQPASMAIKDACKAISAAKKKFLATGEFQDVGFRSKKHHKQNCVIPKSAVSDNGVYHTILGKLLTSEKIPQAEADCRLVLQNGRYYLIVPRKIEAKSCENQAGVVSCDPGLRTFLTTYSSRGVEKIGQAAFSRIGRLCHALDTLTGKWQQAAGASKHRMKKALYRLRNRILDFISELHHKVAAKLTQEFKVVIIPEFNFHPLASKLFSKTVRGFATLAHGKFRQLLTSHAEKRGCRVVYQNEVYTSKTCSACGHIQEIGSRSKWRCTKCNHIHDRDCNGARGIFLRALRDTSWLQELVFQTKLATCISGAK